MECLGGCDDCFALLLADQCMDDQITTRWMMMTLTMRNEDCKNSDEGDDSGDNDFYAVKIKLVTLVCLYVLEEVGYDNGIVDCMQRCRCIDDMGGQDGERGW